MPVIRLATERDAAAVRNIYGPVVESSPTSFEYEIPNQSEIAERIRRTLAQLPWLVAEVDGEVAGYAYSDPYRVRAAYRWACEVSAYVDPDFHRQGVGRELYSRLFDILRLQGFVQSFAGITLPNEASVGFHESMGFRPIGVYRGVGFKYDQWHDVGWWQLTLREVPSKPAPPTSLPSIVTSPEFGAILVEPRKDDS